MTVLALADVSKSYGPQTVLRHCNWEVQAGEKIGLVGANGVGKTTILRLILGAERPDRGDVSVRRGLSVGYMPQEPQLDGRRMLVEEVREGLKAVLDMEQRLHELGHQIAEADPESPTGQRLLDRYGRLQARFEAADGYRHQSRLEATLLGLGLPKSTWPLPVEALSGGQQCRAALARLLLSEPGLLLLDEPSNHLDIDATAWLEGFLNAFAGTVVLISHDRYLLDRVVTKVAELQFGRIEGYRGNYTDYRQAKEVRLAEAQSSYRKQQSYIAHQKALIERYTGSKKSRVADSRRRQLDRMTRSGVFQVQPPGKQRNMAIRFGDVARSGNFVARLRGVAKRYDELTLFEDFSLDVMRGEKIGLIGPNGVGKTTLLRALLGQIAPDAGSVRLGASLSVGYYDQNIEELDRSATVLDELWSVQPDALAGQVRGFLARFLFTGESVMKVVGDLSGGEQSRVVLAKLLFANPNCLALDEPTNHLDIASREVLEQALRDFPGTVLLITHDRYLLDRVAERLIIMEGGRTEIFEGRYAKYEEGQRRLAAEAEAAQARAAEAQRPPARKATPKSRSGKPRIPLRKLEQQIIDAEERLDALATQFADPAVVRDGARMKSLRAKHDTLNARLTELNAEWETRAEAGF